jgi:hypothetical protein
MPMYQRLLVFGCSLTKDNYIDTWADIISKDLNLPLYNFAERGAGYDYIVQKIQTTEIKSDDLVIIMWPSADRYDLYVNDSTPHLQNDIVYASWLDGKSPSFVDYSGNYNSSSGWYINGAVPRGYKHLYYKYFYNQTSHVNKAWSSIALVQHYLDSIDANYLMCNSYPVDNLIQYHNSKVKDFNFQLYTAINFKKFVKDANSSGFIELVSKQHFKFFNPHYPDSDAHRWYVENYIYPKMNEIFLR